jgi:hypothetical protein
METNIFLILHNYPPMKMEEAECSETSAYKIQTSGNYAEKKHTTRRLSMPSAGFETTIPAFKWLRTLALDRNATWNGWLS